MDVVIWTAHSSMGGYTIDWSRLFMRYIGPYKIAHWLRKHDYSCQVIDFITKFNEDQLYQMTTKFITDKTLVLGISTTFLCLTKYTDSKTNKPLRIPEHALNVLTRIKKEFPNLKIVYGGYAAERLESYGVVDATVTSYTTATEDVFLEYVSALKKGTELPYSNIVIPAMSDNPAAKARIHYFAAKNPKYNIEVDDFKFHETDYILPGEPLPLDISRGCIFKCRFCQYPHLGRGKLDYTRAMELVEEELLHNYNHFKTTDYYILDDTFNDTEIKIKAFLDMTKRLPFKISFVAYIRADLIHRFPDTAYMLQESGMIGAYFGLESLHPGASKIVGKGWSGTDAKTYVPELYHNIWKKQVSVHTNFIVGLPGEDFNSIRSTVDWFKDNDLCSINFSALNMYGPESKQPHVVLSEFDRNADQYGFTWGDYDPKLKSRIWYNDKWDSHTAVKFSHVANTLVHPYRKMSPWVIQELRWLGHTTDEVLQDKIVDFNFSVSKNNRQQKIEDYFRMLMSFKLPL